MFVVTFEICFHIFSTNFLNLIPCINETLHGIHGGKVEKVESVQMTFMQSFRKVISKEMKQITINQCVFFPKEQKKTNNSNKHVVDFPPNEGQNYLVKSTVEGYWFIICTKHILRTKVMIQQNSHHYYTAVLRY